MRALAWRNQNPISCHARPHFVFSSFNPRVVRLPWVSKITCGFSKINCGMESWANGNSPKSVVGRNRWILNKKMVKKSGNRVTFGCLIWYKTYFLYYLNFGPFTACFLYGPLVLSVRKQTSFHGLGTAKMAAFFRCEKRKRFRICSKFP